MSVKKHQGLREYRFNQNLHEKAAAELWKSEDRLPDLLGDGQHKAYPTEREYVVAATLMQWLGSPVGRQYVEKLAKEFEAIDKAAERMNDF